MVIDILLQLHNLMLVRFVSGLQLIIRTKKNNSHQLFIFLTVSQRSYFFSFPMNI